MPLVGDGAATAPGVGVAAGAVVGAALAAVGLGADGAAPAGVAGAFEPQAARNAGAASTAPPASQRNTDRRLIVAGPRVGESNARSPGRSPG
jgi:hypothetical protein